MISPLRPGFENLRLGQFVPEIYLSVILNLKESVRVNKVIQQTRILGSQLAMLRAIFLPVSSLTSNLILSGPRGISHRPFFRALHLNSGNLLIFAEARLQHAHDDHMKPSVLVSILLIGLLKTILEWVTECPPLQTPQHPRRIAKPLSQGGDNIVGREVSILVEMMEGLLATPSKVKC